jgi:addiction module RelB/DinJ family antitoxin
MSQSVLTIKIDTDLKSASQSLAKSLGLSLSSVIENKLREVVHERRVVFTEQIIPNAATLAELLAIEDDVAAGKNLSPQMHSFSELEKHLNALK